MVLGATGVTKCIHRVAASCHASSRHGRIKKQRHGRMKEHMSNVFSNTHPAQWWCSPRMFVTGKKCCPPTVYTLPAPLPHQHNRTRPCFSYDACANLLPLPAALVILLLT